MQVHVIDVFWFASGILERDTHRARGLITIFGETHSMISIARCAVTRDLRIDLRAAIGCVFEIFEYVDPRALA